MATASLRLSRPRRAGLLAAVAVYPLSRLAGTLPRPTLDRALLSGMTMGVAYQSTAALAGSLAGLATLVPGSNRTRAGRIALVAGATAAGAVVVSTRIRERARIDAERAERQPISTASIGAAAELLALASGATALVSLADAIGSELPDGIRPTHPAVVMIGVVTAGAALGIAGRDRRFLNLLALPEPEGSNAPPPDFQRGATLPIAAGRSAGVAAATVALISLESWGAESLGALITGNDEPGLLAEIAGHAIIAGGVGVLGLAGFAFYSSRVKVQERMLEDAYAAVPNRSGVSGGPDSAYEFGDLGREGRRFVAQAYSGVELIRVLDAPAGDPVRAFIPVTGLSGSLEHDAQMVVAEVERLGGFRKNTIVLSAPTGDGYVSYVHTETVEMLTAGDCTNVAVQYASLPSALAFPKREQYAAAFAAFASALAARASILNPQAKLFIFGESLGSIVALDSLGVDHVSRVDALGYHGGLYCGVPIYSKTDQALRPRHPSDRIRGGLQYAYGRDDVADAAPGHINLTHPTDPVAVADPSILVRHPIDYWGRPHGVYIPVVTFLVHLFDVKNAMNLRPGEFTPSLGHDYRYETALAVSRAYDLPMMNEDRIEAALRERELAWSVRRLLSKRLDAARDTALLKLRSWGVDPDTLSERFNFSPESIPDWLHTPEHLLDSHEDYLG